MIWYCETKANRKEKKRMLLNEAGCTWRKATQLGMTRRSKRKKR